MKIPAIYQVELTNACQLNCSYCQRNYLIGDRPVGYLDVGQLERWIKRGDFEGTVFIELQQNGEPLMHPEFGKIVRMMKEVVRFVGMSTNGLLVEEWFKEVCMLDTLTLSLHNGVPMKVMEKVIQKLVGGFKWVIRLQILTNANEEVREVFNRWKEKKLQNLICEEFQLKDNSKEVWTYVRGCIDPWYSVSVQWDGDVVPCCNAVGKLYVYGNLNESSLEEIWRSKRVEDMREYQLTGKPPIKLCETCVFKSPHKFHLDILEKSLDFRRN